MFFLIGYLNYSDQVILYSFNLRCSDVVDARLINKRENQNAIVFPQSFVSFRLLSSLETHHRRRSSYNTVTYPSLLSDVFLCLFLQRIDLIRSNLLQIGSVSNEHAC